MRKREIAETPVTYANIVERCRKETVQDAGGISDRAGKPAAAQAMAWWIGKGRCSRRLSPSPRYGKTLAVKVGCAPPGNGWKAGPVVGAKARQSGFGPIVELAAGGRGVEARKGIAPDPGDRNAKPRAVRGAGGACRRNQKARALPRKRQADRSPATGGRQQCRPPFCVWALSRLRCRPTFQPAKPIARAFPSRACNPAPSGR